MNVCPFAVVVSSSCSTDETVVADSEAEDETATSVPETAAAHSSKVIETVNMREGTEDYPVASKMEQTEDYAAASKMEGGEDYATSSYVATFRPSSASIPFKRDTVTETESGNLDIICSQNLVVRDTSTPTFSSTANNEAVNFKRFRKVMYTNHALGITFQLDYVYITLQFVIFRYSSCCSD